jgi:hypothetical protein
VVIANLEEKTLMMRRRRPIARTVARTAVVAGTATAVAGGVSRRQARRNPEPEPQQEYAPVEAAAPAPLEPEVDPLEQLTKLGALKDSGVLTEEEFTQQKAKILAQM